MPNCRAVYSYRPALDGVRGLAVTAVVLFHLGVTVLPGGFLGVDAFFVLSGFLITSLLVGEYRRDGRIRLTAFWARRARRLLPALLMLLVAVVVAGRYLLPPVEVGLLRGDSLAAIGYVANWRMIYRGSDYFTQTAAPSPLQHTWSLGVEEQFYLAWPLIVILVLGRWPDRRGRAVLLTLCGCGTALSAILAAVLYRPADVNRVYFGTDTRAQALLIGAAVGLLVIRYDRHASTARRHPVLGALALAGAIGTVWLWTHAAGTDGRLYHGGLTVAALCVAAVIGHAVTSAGSPTARILSLPPLVLLGRVSYGAYLWHWPLVRFLTAERTGLTGMPLLGLRLGLTLAVAILSYRLVELPLRRGRRPTGMPRPVGMRRPTRVPRWGWTPPMARIPQLARVSRWAPVAVGVTAVVATAASTVWATLPAPTPRPVALPVFSLPPAVIDPGIPAPAGVGPSAAGSATPVPMRRPGRAPGAQPRIDVFGDSVAWTVGTYLPAHPGLTVANRATEGCGITLLNDILETGTPHTLYPYCSGWPAKWTGAVAHDDPDVAVILLNRWELMDAKINGSYQHVGQPAFDGYLTAQLDRAIGIASARHAAVVLLTAAYTHRSERPDGGLYDEDLPSHVDAWNALLRREAAGHPGTVAVLDLNRLVDPTGRYTATLDGVPMRSDGLHYTPAAVQRVIAPWLLPRLEALATTGQP